MSSDTTPDAERHQLEIYRRMTPGRRGEIAMEMSEAARELSRTGIRARHPEYDDDQVRLALLRLLLGDELFQRAFPRAALLAP